ncbi:hypothetical protein H2200_008886 [Cladophialophora chaetospira]|uniref:Heterokaryon incompatibility domain-containing protein n=1 Tax=Cladophialophora chaetospira TaxID=386627 RepID=A0AA38X4X3_9EURO|nr:hypothetical protein H2200_008886 [Cladophialophora chaetospira]
MDHLPAPHCVNKLAPSLLVPLRCDPNGYDNGPLETYPIRKGFQLNYWDDDMKYASILSLPDGSRPSVEQSTILLQEWLFFGLLSVAHSIYGTTFKGHDYVTTHDGISILSLEKVPRDLNAWYDAESARPKPLRRQHYHEIENHLMRALRFLTNNFTSDRQGHVAVPGYPDHTVTQETAISLESNMEIMLMGLQEIMQFINGIFTQRGKKPSGELSSESVCLSTHEAMKSLQWCPSELNFIGLVFDNSSFVFAGGITRQSAHANHSNCSSSKCLAWEVNETTYRPTHVEGCSGCPEIYIDAADLEQRLVTSDPSVVPRLMIDTTDQGKIAVSFTESGEYVAISHVWSDGLGHPKGINSMHECQLRRVKRLVLETGLEKTVMWIDTLCVPAEKGPGKKSALVRMHNVYRSAKHILVLDSDMVSTPSTTCNEELLLRIALSKWNRRLWTLEEGVVAHANLLFQFSDRSIPLPLPNQSISDAIARNCSSLIQQYLPANTDILSVITALHFRSTSRAADEPLCIGHILGIDVSSIVATDDVDERMLRMYQLLAKKGAKFPWQFLFTDEVKLNISPFKWAPRSLMNLEPHDVFYLQGMEDSSDNNVEAIQIERGLQFQAKHSVLLSFSEDADIKKCMILRMGGLSYVLCPMTKRGRLRNHGRYWEGTDKEKCLSIDPMTDWDESWKPQYKFRPTGNWGLIPSKSGSSHAIMVAINEANEKGFFATIVGQVQMYELRTEYSSGISGFNTELWGQVGLPNLDEDKVRQEQDRVEKEVFDADNYSIVNCVARLKEASLSENDL